MEAEADARKQTRGSRRAEPEGKVPGAAAAEAVLKSTASVPLVQTSVCRSVCWFVCRFVCEPLYCILKNARILNLVFFISLLIRLHRSIVCSLTHTLAPHCLLRSCAPLRSFICLLALSFVPKSIGQLQIYVQFSMFSKSM